MEFLVVGGLLTFAFAVAEYRDLKQTNRDLRQWVQDLQHKVNAQDLEISRLKGFTGIERK